MLYGVLGWTSFGRTIAENDVQSFSTAHKKLDWALVYMHSVKAVLRSQKQIISKQNGLNAIERSVKKDTVERAVVG